MARIAPWRHPGIILGVLADVGIILASSWGRCWQTGKVRDFSDLTHQVGLSSWVYRMSHPNLHAKACSGAITKDATNGMINLDKKLLGRAQNFFVWQKALILYFLSLRFFIFISY